MSDLNSLGRYFYACAAVGSGIQQLVRADFVRVVPKLPVWVPAQPFLACAVGGVLIVAGAAILSGYQSRRAALALAALLVATFVFQRVPEIIANPSVGYIWTNPSKVLAFLGGAILLSVWAPGAPPRRHWTGRLRPWSAGLLAVFLIICGYQHFAYADFVDTLVPAWFTHPRFWTCFTGSCLLAGGVGIMIPATARWAAIMAGVMVFLWVLVLHLPRAVTMSREPGETSAIFEALAISGVAFLVAGGRSGGRADRGHANSPAVDALDQREAV